MNKILKISKPPQLTPKVALKWEWRDDQNRRCSQYIVENGIEEQEAENIAESVNRVVQEAKDTSLLELQWKLNQITTALNLPALDGYCTEIDKINFLIRTAKINYPNGKITE